MTTAKLDPDAFVETHRETLEAVPDPVLRATLESMGRTIAKRTQEEQAQQPEPERTSAQVIQLPLWPEPKRGVPNPILRAALFAAIHGKDRRFINDDVLAAVQGIIIRFKGEQLNQEDLEVCAAVFHLARVHPVGDTCHTSAHGFLKLLGRKTGNSQHVQLHQSLRRLMQPLEIQIGRYRYSGALIMEGVKDDITRHYIVRINQKLAGLFAQGWTGLEWEQRHDLRGKPLALWLHGFYASHAAPYPYKVETLRELCGSRAKTLYSFRQQLREALDDLKDDAIGAIEAWDIDKTTDLVHVKRGTAVSASQRRHLGHSKFIRRIKK